MSKTETAHTQEPWAAGVTVIDGKQYFAVAEAKNTKRVLALCGLVGADDEAESIGNARRIAGAINALKYLGQDRLDEGWNWLENGEAFIETAAELDRVKLLLTAKDAETEVLLSKKDDDYAHGVALLRAKIGELTAERDALTARLAAPAVAGECWCDQQGLGIKGVSCGDCPRDYAKPAVADGAGWLPIETAPKDMESRLFRVNDFCVQGFIDATGVLCAQNDRQPWRKMHGKPTHWMPIPAAPGA